jgi:hypothetical protein
MLPQGRLGGSQGKQRPWRKLSYESQAAAGKWQRGDTESVKNL